MKPVSKSSTPVIQLNEPGTSTFPLFAYKIGNHVKTFAFTILVVWSIRPTQTVNHLVGFFIHVTATAWWDTTLKIPDSTQHSAQVFSNPTFGPSFFPTSQPTFYPKSKPFLFTFRTLFIHSCIPRYFSFSFFWKRGRVLYEVHRTQPRMYILRVFEY